MSGSSLPMQGMRLGSSSTATGMVLGAVIAIIAIIALQLIGINLPLLTTVTTVTETTTRVETRTVPMTVYRTVVSTERIPTTITRTVSETHTVTKTTTITNTKSYTITYTRTVTKIRTETRVSISITPVFITRTSTVTTTVTETVTTPKIVVASYTPEYSSIEEALRSLTRRDIELVGEILFGSFRPTSVADAVWHAIAWADRNLGYDYERACTVQRLSKLSVYHPLELIRRGKGICTDFALLYTVAMLYENITPVYIFELWDYHHVVAIIPINNTLVVLEQKLPPIEFSDYVEHMLGGKLGSVTIYKVALDGEKIVYRITNLSEVRKLIRDTYPKDSLDPKLALEVAKIVSNRFGLSVEPRLVQLAQGGLYTLTMESPTVKLTESPVSVKIFELYSPMFRDMWVRYLADMISKYIEPIIKYGKYLWISMGDAEINITLAPIRPPYAYHVVNESSLTIFVNSTGRIVVAVYTPDLANIVLEVIPPGTRVSIPHIEMEKLIEKNGSVTIVINRRLLDKALTIDKACIVVVLDGYPVYAFYYTKAS